MVKASARLWLGLLGLWLLAGCATTEPGADADSELAEARAASTPQTEVPYTVAVSLTGTDDADLEGYLLSVSEANASTANPPPTRFALSRRASGDTDRLEQALRSKGFYDAEVTYTITKGKPPKADQPQAQVVTFEAKPGTRYQLASVNIELVGEPSDFTPPALADVGLAVGDPADAGAVLDAEGALLTAARNDARPFAELGERSAFINQDTKTMEVVLRVNPGRQHNMAAPTFVGSEGIDTDYLARFSTWTPGDPYDPEQVRELRRELTTTGLFNAATISLGETPDAEGNLPVTVEVKQRKHRTVSAGVRYETDNGVGGNLSWEHRNFFGAGERFNADLNVSQVIQFARVRLNKGNFYHRDLSFLSEAQVRREDTDAFKSNSVGASAGLEYDFDDENSVQGAIRYRLSEQEQDDETETYKLLSFPLIGRFDNTDQPLDPSRGVKAALLVQPFFDLQPEGGQFQKLDAGASTYLQVIEDPRFILAGRVRYGTLVGASLDDVPPDERFYAGGGGSVRGVPFQAASPRDPSGTIIGGLSVFEIAGEVRANVTEAIGVVVFVDAGRAFESSSPSLGEDLIIGTGAGVRYNTPVGPLRADIGVPINNDRDDFDDPFQIYVSLGQAF